METENLGHTDPNELEEEEEEEDLIDETTMTWGKESFRLSKMRNKGVKEYNELHPLVFDSVRKEGAIEE